MKHIKIIITVFFLQILILMSCKERVEHKVKRTYYEGKIQSEITYLDTIMDGKAVYYHENGRIYREEYYKNGRQDSIFKEYYDNGILSEQGMYNYDSLMGSLYGYYMSGHIKAYNAKGYSGKTFYSIFYDSAGTKRYEEGLNICPDVVTFSEKKIYSTRDTVHIIWCIAEPPGYKNNITIGIKKNGLFVSNLQEYIVKRSIIDFKKKFADIGTYQIIVCSELKDTLDNYTNRDTSIVDVIVK